jgi:hypothetical protein
MSASGGPAQGTPTTGQGTQALDDHRDRGGSDDAPGIAPGTTKVSSAPSRLQSACER